MGMELLGHMVEILRDCQAVYKVAVHFAFHLQCLRDLISPVSSAFIDLHWIMAILVGVKWFYIVSLIYISLMTNDVTIF
jgi:hypothetical protein